MKHFRTLLLWDIRLLHRNRIFLLAGLVALIYTGLFYVVRPEQNPAPFLVILLFNDPVMTGYVFAAVLWLFDKDQHTLQAISVLPIPLHYYLFSKATILSVLSTLVALVIALAVRGTGYGWMDLLAGTFLSTFLFAGLGFAVGSKSRNFNEMLLYSIPLLILSGLPLLPMAGLGTALHFLPFPSTGGLGLLQQALGLPVALSRWGLYAHLLLFNALAWAWAFRLTQKQLL